MNKKQKKTLQRIIIAAILTVALALLFHFVALPWFVQLILWLVPYLVIGHDVLRKAFMGIKNGEVFDENFLMAIATVGAVACGEYSEGVAVMLFYQIGELFQSYAVGKSRSSITALMDIRPESANLEDAEGNVSVVDPDDVEIGSIIVVKPGEKIPLDGKVVSGESTLNTAALTGESRPRTVRPGDDVISGCVNEEGILRIETTTLYDDSTVAKILDLVENSSLKKSPIENFITKFARYYTPAVCIGALVLAFVPPLFLGNWLDWIMRALTFLVISCPCALVISIPLTFFGGIGGASKCGILVKGGNYLEALSKTSIAVFDKTGTLTKGVFKVTQVIPINGKAYDLQMMEYAALAESVSNHPIAKSIQRACPDLDPRRVTEAKEIAGQGVKAKVDGHWVLAGNKKLMDAENVNMYQNGEGDGKFGTVVYIAVDGKFRGILVISDEVKPTSKQAIINLIVQGVHTVMLTGDSPRVGEYVAKELGVQEVHGGLLPADKVEWVEKLLAAKRPRTELAFVGDGINDAPALAQADLGIAIGTGTDVAMQSADVTLMSGDLRGVIKTINLSNATMRNIRENLGWAFGYNVIGIPVAAGVLYPFTGWLLSPMIAGLAMALSSVCLVLNANRLHGANINVGAADGPAGSGSSTADVESAGSAESANAANITGSATSNAPHEPTVIIDDRTTLNQTNHVSDQSNNPTNKENTMDTGMHMHHTAPADGETATDPVCGMTVAVNADAITREYEGKSYYFCGEHCATNFMKAPQVFLEQ